MLPALHYNKKTDPEAFWIQADGLRLPFKEAGFDIVFSKGVMFQIADWEMFVSGLCNLSKNHVLFNFKGTNGVTLADTAKSFQYLTPAIKIPLVFIAMDDMVAHLRKIPFCRNVEIHYADMDFTKFGNSPVRQGFAADVHVFIDKNRAVDSLPKITIYKTKQVLEW